MAKAPISFGTQSHPGRYGVDTGPRLINMTAEPVEGGKTTAPLYMFDGLELFSTLDNGGRFRGGIVFNDLLYVVSGTGFYRINIVGEAMLIGGVAGTAPVWMARNYTQIVIVCEGAAYIYEGGALTPVADPDLMPPISVTTVNARSVYASPDGRIMYSEVEDAGNIGTASFLEAEADPDGVVAAIEHKQDLWAFGTTTTEVIRDTGAEIDPFRRLGAPIEKGCCAPHSIRSIGETILWVGNDNVVYASAGSGYEALSHEPVGRSIAALPDRSVMTAKAYYWRDQPFYELSADTFTWVLNLKTKRWTEARSYGMQRRRTEGAVDFAGGVILGDVSEGKLYRMSPTAQDEAGNRFVGLLRSGPVHAFPDQIIIDRLDLDFQTGVGLNSTNPDVADPKIGMRVSNDGGATWTNQRLAHLGAIGNRRVSVSFPRLGATGRNGSIIEIEMSPAVVRAFLGAVAHGRPAKAR